MLIQSTAVIFYKFTHAVRGSHFIFPGRPPKNLSTPLASAHISKSEKYIRLDALYFGFVAVNRASALLSR
jgi:hypothetical protein